MLSLEYLNAGWDDVNGFRARYQGPLVRPRATRLDESAQGRPGLGSTGCPGRRSRGGASTGCAGRPTSATGASRPDAAAPSANVSNDEVRTEQIQATGRFIYETWQYRNFFVDLWSGFRLRNVQITNETGAGKGEQLFAIPRAGIHAERISQISILNVDFSAEGSVGNTSDDDIERLGRADADGQYALLEWNAGYSTYLEPLLFPNAWKDPSTERTSTLAHEGRLLLQRPVRLRLPPRAPGHPGGGRPLQRARLRPVGRRR